MEHGAGRVNSHFDSCYHAPSTIMNNPRELAFRYDLFITPDWRDRLDTLINESIKLPIEARIIDVNCGPVERMCIKFTNRVSYDEFFSIYREALYETGMADDVWTSLERLINERRTVSEAELMVERSELRNVESFISREEFSYQTAEEFLE